MRALVTEETKNDIDDLCANGHYDAIKEYGCSAYKTGKDIGCDTTMFIAGAVIMIGGIINYIIDKKKYK
jgi:hypothetical protein